MFTPAHGEPLLDSGGMSSQYLQPCVVFENHADFQRKKLSRPRDGAMMERLSVLLEKM